ncbi:MAG: DUF4440 domain-containing protein [Balneolaceae bacterium]|nr:DUF4440 domain-containing protein [Balneolaceae bacterium]
MRLFVLFISAILLSACDQKINDKQHSDNINAINEIREREEIGAEAGDVELLLSLRTDDFISIPPNQPPVEGKKAVGEFLTEIHEQTDTELTFISDEIIIAGDWAYDRGTLEGIVTPENDGEPVNIEGVYLFILKRQVDNSWKYSRAMWSSY